MYSDVHVDNINIFTASCFYLLCVCVYVFVFESFYLLLVP